MRVLLYVLGMVLVVGGVFCMGVAVYLSLLDRVLRPGYLGPFSGVIATWLLMGAPLTCAGAAVLAVATRIGVQKMGPGSK
jgi:hypothetical protein